MNKPTQFSMLALAAGLSGVAIFALADLAALSGIAIADAFAFVAAAAIVAFAVTDYARQPKRLRLPSATFTPSPRAQVNGTAVAAGPRARATAYGLPRNRNQRLAA